MVPKDLAKSYFRNERLWFRKYFKKVLDKIDAYSSESPCTKLFKKCTLMALIEII